jgi:DNA-binding transcriptional ArsR family regulator
VESAFRALADPSRRLLLDRLFEEDGRTLGELCRYLPGMTRFGVMRHLAVLEAAELVTTRRVGREKRHYLNPVPIRLIHDRWISKYAEPVVGSMTALKRHLEVDPMAEPQHVYSIYIRTTPAALWRAITDGDETVRYFYGTRVASDWRVGSAVSYTYPDGSVAADGEVLEIEPGRRVLMTFHARWDPDLDAEGPVRQAWEISDAGDGLCKLSVLTDDMGPKTAKEFGGGIVYIVSGLKTVLETEPVLAAG